MIAAPLKRAVEAAHAAAVRVWIGIMVSKFTYHCFRCLPAYGGERQKSGVDSPNLPGRQWRKGVELSDFVALEPDFAIIGAISGKWLGL